MNERRSRPPAPPTEPPQTQSQDPRRQRFRSLTAVPPPPRGRGASRARIAASGKSPVHRARSRGVRRGGPVLRRDLPYYSPDKHNFRRVGLVPDRSRRSELGHRRLRDAGNPRRANHPGPIPDRPAFAWWRRGRRQAAYSSRAVVSFGAARLRGHRAVSRHLTLAAAPVAGPRGAR